MSAKKTMHTTTTPEATEHLGTSMAEQLGGRIIFLFGDLGVGKTTFVRGVARGLGITELIKSPTFVYEKTYVIPAKAGIQTTNNKRYDTAVVHHLDLYRFETMPAEFSEHLRELFVSGDTIIVEWPERIPAELLPQQRVEIHFKETGRGREIVINERMMQ